MITAYRLVKPKYAEEAFSGEGSRKNGGRWNLRGHAMVYVSSTAALVERHTRAARTANDRHEWLISGSSAVLAVPSAVIPTDLNYLLNPEHPDFRSIEIGLPRPFRLDFRLMT